MRNKINPNLPLPEEFLVYGTAGQSMENKEFSQKFGKNSTASGSKGENILFHELRKPGGILPANIPLMCSLKVPGYSSDIDFAVAMGNKVLLIDAKFYQQDGGWYWNTKGDRTTFHKNFGKYKTRNGNVVKLSKSDIASENILDRQLKFTDVKSAVVFVTDPSNPSAKAPHVHMKFPGEVEAFNMKNFEKFFVKFFHNSSGYNHVTHNNIKYLSSLCQ